MVDPDDRPADVSAALGNRRRARPHRPVGAAGRVHRTGRAIRAGTPLALPDAGPRRPPSVGVDVPRPTRPRTLAMLVRRSPRRRRRPGDGPHERRDRAEAIDWLANRAGMIPDRPLPPIPREAAPVRSGVDDESGRRPLRRVCAHRCSAGRKADRSATGCTPAGSSDHTIQANRIGADPGRDRCVANAACPTARGSRRRSRRSTRPATSPTSRPATSTPKPPAASTTTRPPRWHRTPASPSRCTGKRARRGAARVRRDPGRD